MATVGIEEEIRKLRKDLLSTTLLADAQTDSSAPRHVRLLLVGPIGAGKSAFVNSVEKALLETTTMSANIQLSHAEGSFFLDEYYRDARSCFSILDMRGQTEWFDKSHSEVVEIFNILDGSIAPGNCLLRKIELTYVDRSALEYLAQTAPFNGEKVHEDGWIVPDYLDDEEDEDEDEDEDSASQASEGSCEPRAPTVIQCVLFVYSNYEFVLRNATNGRIRLVKKAMAPLRDYMRKQGIKPMCILTHMDNTHHGPARLEQTKKQAQLLTGCSPADVFCVTNYASETFHEENDPNLDVAVLRAVRHAVINATACVTRQHELRQEEAKKKIKAADFKEVMARGTPEDDLPISSLLLVLQAEFNWPDTLIRDALRSLEDQDIVTAGLLREYWNQEPVMKASIPDVLNRPLQEVLGIS